MASWWIRETVEDIRWVLTRRWRALRRCISWMPVVWRICDCCYGSLYEVMHHQISRMEEFHRNDSIHLTAEERADEMKYTRLLLERLIAEDYLGNALTEFRQVWGEGTFLTRPTPDGTANEYLGMWWSKARTAKENERANQWFRRCCKHSDYMEQQDLDELFSHLHKRVRGWWH